MGGLIIRKKMFQEIFCFTGRRDYNQRDGGGGGGGVKREGCS